MSLHLDHIAIAVREIESAVRAWCDLLGAEPFGSGEEIGDQGVREQHLRAGAFVLQLLEPLGADSPVGRFLSRRGPGLHHLAVRVANLEATLARLRTSGVKLIDEIPRQGSRGTRVAFVHPEATGGVLVELVQQGESGEDEDAGGGCGGPESASPGAGIQPAGGRGR